MVKEWYDINQPHHEQTETLVPEFHVETTHWKWGKTQADVLSIHCTNADAKYMKYLIVEGCSQGKLDQGVFVPSGIHLMEGKEVLHRLLAEQHEFIEDTTSVQVEGISYEELDSPGEDNKLYGTFY